MEEEYSKYLISKLFSDYEDNYEYEIMSYEQMSRKRRDERQDSKGRQHSMEKEYERLLLQYKDVPTKN